MRSLVVHHVDQSPIVEDSEHGHHRWVGSSLGASGLVSDEDVIEPLPPRVRSPSQIVLPRLVLVVDIVLIVISLVLYGNVGIELLIHLDEYREDGHALSLGQL